MKVTRLLVIILSGFLVHTCLAQLEFVGYMTSTDGPRFSVKEAKQEQSSGWLRLGDTYSGFKLLAHDPQKAILSVEKDGNRSDLHLKQDRVVESDAKESGKPKIAEVKIQFAGAASISEQVVRENINLRPGDELNEVAIDSCIRALYRTGRFKQIEIKHETRPSGTVDLVVIVTPK